MGTVGYMAPEQVRAQPLDGRADLFALGAVLYEMLTGLRAFHRDTAADTMTAILKEDPPELTASRADLSPVLDRIVRHCLEKNPIERFQTARDVAFALDSLSGSGSGSGAAMIAAVTASPRPARERWLWAAVTVVLAAALAWQIVALRRAAETAPVSPSRLTLLLPEGIRISDSAVCRRTSGRVTGRTASGLCRCRHHQHPEALVVHPHRRFLPRTGWNRSRRRAHLVARWKMDRLWLIRQPRQRHEENIGRWRHTRRACRYRGVARLEQGRRDPGRAGV